LLYSYKHTRKQLVKDLPSIQHQDNMFNSTIIDFFAANNLFSETNWIDLSACGQLTDDFIRGYYFRLNMKTVIESQVVSTEVITEFFNVFGIQELDWIATYYPMTEELAELFGTKYPLSIVWNRISYVTDLSEDFMDRYVHFLDWNIISSTGLIKTDLQLLKYADLLNWSLMSVYMQFSEWALVYFADRIVWKCVIKMQKLTEELIRYIHLSAVWTLLDWEYAYQYQHIPEDVLENHKDTMNWKRICKYQTLSPEFMTRNADYLDWEMVSKYRQLTWTFYQLFSDKLTSCPNVDEKVDHWSKFASIESQLGFDLWTHFDKFVAVEAIEATS